MVKETRKRPKMKERRSKDGTNGIAVGVAVRLDLFPGKGKLG